MSLTPLWESNSITILHALAAILAMTLGALQLIMQKGSPSHRYLGRFWVGIMAVVALSSFAIHDIRMLGPFSVIDILSVLVLYSLWQAINAVRKGDIKTHKRTMINLYILGLFLTGSFTLLPGRIMHQVFFG